MYVYTSTTVGVLTDADGSEKPHSIVRLSAVREERFDDIVGEGEGHDGLSCLLYTSDAADES